MTGRAYGVDPSAERIDREIGPIAEANCVVMGLRRCAVCAPRESVSVSGTATTTIIEALNETSEGPKRLIGEIVSVLGEQVALELLRETEAIESSGGQMVKRGTRRRTPGGVFFRLAKGKMSAEQRRTVFAVLESERKPKPKKPPPQPPPRSPKRIDRGARPSRPARPDRAAMARDVSAASPIRRRRIVEVGSVSPAAGAPPPFPAAPAMSRREVAPRQPSPAADRPGPPRRRIVSTADNLVKLPHPVSPVKLVKQQERGRRDQPDVTTARSRISAILDMLDRDQARLMLVELALQWTGLKGVDARRQLDRDLDRWAPRTPETPQQPGGRPADEETAPSGPEAGALRARVLASVTDALGLSESDLARALFDDESADARRRASKLLRELDEHGE